MEPGTTAYTAKSAETSYLIRLFRGDVSLPITYWVFGGLIGGVGLNVIEKQIEAHRAAIVASSFGRWFVNGFSFLTIAYTVFIFIAIWRSAGKYTGTKVWAVLARVAVGLGALSIVVMLALGIVQGLREAGVSRTAVKEKITELNKGMPRMIDSGTRLNRIAMVGRDLHYDCTLIKYLASDLNEEKFSSAMRKKLTKGLCSKKETRAALDDGRNFVYEFHDKIGKPIATIAVQDSGCLLAP